MENVFYPSEINQLKERINNRTSLSPCSYNVGEKKYSSGPGCSKHG